MKIIAFAATTGLTVLLAACGGSAAGPATSEVPASSASSSAEPSSSPSSSSAAPSRTASSASSESTTPNDQDVRREASGELETIAIAIKDYTEVLQGSAATLDDQAVSQVQTGLETARAAQTRWDDWFNSLDASSIDPLLYGDLTDYTDATADYLDFQDTGLATTKKCVKNSGGDAAVATACFLAEYDFDEDTAVFEGYTNALRNLMTELDLI